MKAPCQTSYYRYCWDQHDPNIVVVLSPDIVKMPDTIKWGDRGSRIIGSAYVRDFCRVCVEPIRVSKAVIGSESPCCGGCRGQKTLSSGSWVKEVWWSDYRYHGGYYE
jgi:hypothetical protein